MSEELVQNGVMNEKKKKREELRDNVKIDPKVVMGLSIFKIGGWNSLQTINQKLLEEFIDENEPWSIGIPCRDPFLETQHSEPHSVSLDQHMKKLSLREGLQVMMLCYMRCIVERTYDEEIYNRINHLLRERTCVQVECSEDAISEHVRKTTGFYTNSWRIQTALESYFEEHAQEVWERNWMNPEMQTTLLNTHPPTLMATISEAAS